MDIAETCRAALGILDRDGWNKGALTWLEGFSPDYPVGSHCIGGAVNLAALGCEEWNLIADPVYVAIRKVIETQYPEFVPVYPFGVKADTDIFYIAMWNNDGSVTEADVRLVLEKVAAQ